MVTVFCMSTLPTPAAHPAMPGQALEGLAGFFSSLYSGSVLSLEVVLGDNLASPITGLGERFSWREAGLES
jgi:hypothetical protein